MPKTNPFLTGSLPKPAMTLKEKVVSSVLVTDFYEELLGPDTTFVKNMICPFEGHEDTNESFRVREDGSFKCFGCGESGSNIVQFYSSYRQITFQSALKHLAHQYVTKIDQNEFFKKVQSFKRALKKDESFSKFLQVYGHLCDKRSLQPRHHSSSSVY